MNSPADRRVLLKVSYPEEDSILVEYRGLKIEVAVGAGKNNDVLHIFYPPTARVVLPDDGGRIIIRKPVAEGNSNE